jgi:hypothetical protein
MITENHFCQLEPFGATDDMLKCSLCERIVEKKTMTPLPIHIAGNGAITLGAQTETKEGAMHYFSGNKIIMTMEAKGTAKPFQGREEDEP